MKKVVIPLMFVVGVLMIPVAASAQGMTISQLVELFISIGVIAPDKAAAARTAINNAQSTPLPTVKVAYPDGGQELAARGDSSGTIAVIKWNTANFGSRTIDIDLINVNGRVVRNIASNVQNNGSFPWKAGLDISNGLYKILVGSHDQGPTAQDYSDGFFTITSAPAHLTQQNVKNTDAYRQLRENIRQLYLKHLKREPEQLGWDYWADNGLTLAQIEQGILDSYEYRTFHKNTGAAVSATAVQNSASGVPTLSSIVPTSAAVGQNVTIYGVFSTKTNNTVYVKYDGKTYTVAPNFQNGSSLQFTVPLWLKDKGTVSLSVENGNAIMSNNSLPLTVTTISAQAVAAPLRVDLLANRTDGAAKVEKQKSLTLSWNAVSATSCMNNWNQSHETSGSATFAASENKVYTVTCTDGLKESRDSVTVTVVDSYSEAVNRPVINRISPMTARVGIEVTISGTNFSANNNTIYVKTQGTTATIIPSYQNANEVRFTLPIWAKNPIMFAVENADANLSAYVDFTVIQ